MRFLTQGFNVSIGRSQFAIFVTADAPATLTGHDPEPAFHPLKNGSVFAQRFQPNRDLRWDFDEKGTI